VIGATTWACSSQDTGPLQILSYDAPASTEQAGTLVLLRGRGADHRSFARAGWIDAVAARGLPYAVVAPNTHVGYYRDQTVVDRLKAEVVDPILTQGASQVWLVGVSMGGLGALWYLKEHPQDVAGVVLFSPYLGSDEVIAEITDAGGLAAWEPSEVDPLDWERALWAWLHQLTSRPQLRSRIYLGYGRQDKFLAADRLLADALPADQVLVIEGKHRTKTFTQLWELFLDRNVLGNERSPS